MGSGYEHKCNKCGYVVNSSGLWEFYRDAKGAIKDYGHPVPISKEAAEKGVQGFYAIFYCPTCDKTAKIVVVESKEPVFDKLDLWSFNFEPIDEHKEVNLVKCPKCKNDKLLFGDEDKYKTKCPKCKEGFFKSLQIWIS